MTEKKKKKKKISKVTQHETPRSKIHKATQNNNNTTTTPLKQSKALTTAGLMYFYPIILNTL